MVNESLSSFFNNVLKDRIVFLKNSLAHMVVPLQVLLSSSSGLLCFCLLIFFVGCRRKPKKAVKAIPKKEKSRKSKERSRRSRESRDIEDEPKKAPSIVPDIKRPKIELKEVEKPKQVSLKIITEPTQDDSFKRPEKETMADPKDPNYHSLKGATNDVFIKKRPDDEQQYEALSTLNAIPVSTTQAHFLLLRRCRSQGMKLTNLMRSQPRRNSNLDLKRMLIGRRSDCHSSDRKWARPRLKTRNTKLSLTLMTRSSKEKLRKLERHPNNDFVNMYFVESSIALSC
uniref:Uncharacterized protein n=1 Tax=Ditylenchus dipsaci TaxID=166011 RepID=A0A915EDU4_9BILA